MPNNNFHPLLRYGGDSVEFDSFTKDAEEAIALIEGLLARQRNQDERLKILLQLLRDALPLLQKYTLKLKYDFIDIHRVVLEISRCSYHHYHPIFA